MDKQQYDRERYQRMKGEWRERRDPLRAKYNWQKARAKNRGVGWLFTFESWVQWWQDTAKFDLRGPLAEDYCMARIGDTGPYSLSNVECITNQQNSYDGRIRALGGI